MDSIGSEPLNRRHFLRTTAKFLAALPLFGLFGASLLKLRPSFYQKAWLRRDFSANPVTVFKMVPLPGVKYGNAEIRHMANKIFPSIDAARARRQHPGFLYGLKKIVLPRSQTNGMDEYTLFCGRKDLDARVASDRRHWQRLGIDIDQVFSVIRNA